jgi:DNA polymerase V
MSDLSQSLVLSLPSVSKGTGDQVIGVKSDNSITSAVTLDDLLIPKPASTLIFPVRDPAAIEYELEPGDLLIVDRATDPADGQLVILSTNNELHISRHNLQEAKSSSNLSEAPEIGCKSLPIWGAVTYIIRKQ